MSAPTGLQIATAQMLRAGTSVQALPRRQAAWVGAQTLAALLFALAGLWSSQPELALTLSLGAGAAAVNPRKLWAAPLVLAAVMGGGMFMSALDWSPILGAGAVVGLAVAWLLPESTDGLDYVNSALAGAASSTLGLWAADQILPELIGNSWVAVAGSALVGLVASQTLVPLSLRFDNPSVPTARQIQRQLQPLYRPPVFQAVDLYATASQHAPDTVTRRGLAEIATWVFHLQRTLQTQDQELASGDAGKIEERIRACESDTSEDPFTRERRQATASHLRRLLDHRVVIQTERRRTEALVEYALAFLEEARADLAVARELPGEATPDRLPEVLGRLRTHAADGDARRKTAREMGKISV